MKQLIIKDFIVQWKILVWYFLYPFLLYSATKDSHSVFAFMTVIIPIMVMVRTFYSDEKNKSEKIFNSLPVSRKQIVLAKYIFALVILIISVIIAYFTVGIQLKAENAEFIKTTVFPSISLILIFLSLVLPVYFMLGYQKTFIIAFFILIAPIFILEFFFKINIEKVNLHSGFLYMGATCMLVLSMLVCTKLYERREI
ncbi:ABC-2 transporter permease [Bacillus gaemokensis]|uniref:ABC transporter permease n=1 Tax=Bacillus gaemokensis TaxID=574375 RepID=A0A073KFV5_9BACI|nr:ABC-2 transporter permease [Bacillus gaemokensis]KEK26149.1 ABC transporter permease [Bacillus gaemokensis]KYG38958.1 ABC transporter permease [Bacillus gaemokensis]